MAITPQLIIAMAIVVGLLGFLCIVGRKLGTLSQANDSARDAFLKLMNPAGVAADSAWPAVPAGDDSRSG